MEELLLWDESSTTEIMKTEKKEMTEADVNKRKHFIPCLWIYYRRKGQSIFPQKFPSFLCLAM